MVVLSVRGVLTFNMQQYHNQQHHIYAREHSHLAGRGNALHGRRSTGTFHRPPLHAVGPPGAAQANPGGLPAPLGGAGRPGRTGHGTARSPGRARRLRGRRGTHGADPVAGTAAGAAGGICGGCGHTARGGSRQPAAAGAGGRASGRKHHHRAAGRTPGHRRRDPLRHAPGQQLPAVGQPARGALCATGQPVAGRSARLRQRRYPDFPAGSRRDSLGRRQLPPDRWPPGLRHPLARPGRSRIRAVAAWRCSPGGTGARRAAGCGGLWCRSRRHTGPAGLYHRRLPDDARAVRRDLVEFPGAATPLRRHAHGSTRMQRPHPGFCRRHRCCGRSGGCAAARGRGRRRGARTRARRAGGDPDARRHGADRRTHRQPLQRQTAGARQPGSGVDASGHGCGCGPARGLH